MVTSMKKRLTAADTIRILMRLRRMLRTFEDAEVTTRYPLTFDDLREYIEAIELATAALMYMKGQTHLQEPGEDDEA